MTACGDTWAQMLDDLADVVEAVNSVYKCPPGQRVPLTSAEAGRLLQARARVAGLARELDDADDGAPGPSFDEAADAVAVLFAESVAERLHRRANAAARLIFALREAQERPRRAS